MFISEMAGHEGFEPSQAVLEAAVLPLTPMARIESASRSATKLTETSSV